LKGILVAEDSPENAARKASLNEFRPEHYWLLDETARRT
jgi:hypothetical protein